jgi:aryl-alcohol dehydrogenase-like predicted oxidoreductase
MEMRRFGRTELSVSCLSLGGLFTSSLAGGVAETTRILRRALELGINFLDTAPAYADSEQIIGQALTEVESGAGAGTASIRLATKLGGRPQPFNPRDITGLRSSVEQSLRLLNREQIEILFIHEPDRPRQYPWWTNYDPLQGPVLEVIEQLKQQGKIRFAGLAGTTVTELTRLIQSGSFDVVLTAFNYNPLFREAAADLIPQAHWRDMGIVAGSTLGQGFLARRFDEELKRSPIWLSPLRKQQFLAYYQLLDQTGLSPVEMGIRFALSHPGISTIPIGCKTMSQLEESVQAAAKGPLPEDLLQQLDLIAAMVPCRPFEEPMILPFGKPYFGPGIANLAAATPVGKL